MTAAIDFESLVTKHSAEIFAYIWRMLRDTPDAEDCLQETFLRAYRAFPRLPIDANHRAWLYKIATNTARTHIQRRTRDQRRVSDLDPDLQSDRSSLLDGLDQRERLTAVARAVEALPYQQKAALIMKKYQDLSYEAIAAALNCSEDAARANVYQALKKLRAQFTEDLEVSRWLLNTLRCG
jgi:RNA polymerase sigma-70 factor (ECF subfamily)